MDRRLLPLIEAYQQSVADAVRKLVGAGIDAPRSNTEWATNGIPQKGTLASGERYFKHGYGCAFAFADAKVVDFDFGARGEIDGFDPHRLWQFAEQMSGACGFHSCEELQIAIDHATSTGELTYSGYILFYVRSAVSND